MSDVKTLIDEQINVHGKKREALMPILQAIVGYKNYVADEDMVEVAKALDLSAADVFGTASFYTFLDTKERGKYVIRVCKTIACHMAGKDEIIDALKTALNLKVGETTGDKKFTLLTANCLGWCHKGPVMLINDKVYPELTVQKALAIVEEYSKAK